MIEALFVLVTRVVIPVVVAKGGIDSKRYNVDRLPYVAPFAFSLQKKNEPTEFIAYFRTDLAEYRYELHIKNNEIVFEKLNFITCRSKEMKELFRRIKNTFLLKESLNGLSVSDNLSVSVPLLAYLGLTYDKNKVVKDVINWFVNKLDIINYGNPQQEMQLAVASTDKVKNIILKMMRKLDLDIEDFRTEEDNSGMVKAVYTTHVADGYKTELEMRAESRGTRKVFGMLPYIARSLLEGRVLVIDELDAKLHPLLLKYIIGLFSDMEINRNQAQIIFTSHDLSTMNSSVFRRDEIWFVAKGKQQDSQLYSLVEFKVDKEQKKNKNGAYDQEYLQGKYGADPYLQKIISWGEIDE